MPLLDRLRRLFFPRKNPRPNLGLWGDLDDVEILEDVERVFQVQFNDEEAEETMNLGEFFDATSEKMKLNGRDLTWDEFTKILEPHGTMAAFNMKRETEFFREI